MTTATRVDTRITHKPHSSSLDRARLRGFAVDAVRYFGVSLVALAVDWGGLALAHHTFGLNYLAAATVSFAAGLMVAWSLSAAFVFPGRRKLSLPQEFTGFLLTGIVGLLLTQIGLALLVGGAGLSPELAKAPVAALVFAFNFVSRRAFLFAPAELSR